MLQPNGFWKIDDDRTQPRGTWGAKLQYFVTSDEVAIANQIKAILDQLHHDCPVSHIVRLDLAVSILESAAAGVPRLSPDGAHEPEDIVLVVLAPDAVKALTVVRNIRQRTTARVLAVGPATDTKLVLHTMREGATEYLDQVEIKTELAGALQRLGATETSGRVIAILAPGGGTGSSTLAVNVATALAQKHQSCALIDLKLEAGDLAPLLNLKPNHTLSDLCQNVERMDYSLMQGCLTRCDSGVQLLAAPARIADVGLVTPDAVDAVLSLVSHHFPYIVLDLDHTFRPEQRRAMLQADVIVLVLRLDFISLRNTRTTLDYLQANGVIRDKIRLVANQVGEPNQLSPAQAEESLGIKFLQQIPDDPKSVNRANNDGIPVVLQSPWSKVSRSVLELATKLAIADKSGG